MRAGDLFPERIKRIGELIPCVAGTGQPKPRLVLVWMNPIAMLDLIAPTPVPSEPTFTRESQEADLQPDTAGKFRG